ncbi:MAG: hypothetical protein JWM88_738 [Verrucomicrobia bacterium]|nr:hypothetical protein [Verrucomicrobiota bacterium]
MARKPRIEFAGAIYEVVNRGNYRADLFETPGAAQAFVDCLFQGCERMHWKVHAYCLLRDQYRLALETPQGNLVDGVHWLQSTFGNRFNRFRGENGRAFQGRYKSVLVEAGEHLADLVDSVHLAPVRAGLVAFDQLRQFRWSSYRVFQRPRAERPVFLEGAEWLGVRGLGDTADDWDAYHRHLAAVLAADREAKVPLSPGWIRGSEKFRHRILAEFKRMAAAKDWGGSEVRELNRLEWGRLLADAMAHFGQGAGDTLGQPKAAPWKIAIATWLKSRTSVNNRWLAEQLHLGGPDAVSRYVGECQRGVRKEARRLLDGLVTDIRG